jgi:hypothetical protein
LASHIISVWQSSITLDQILIGIIQILVQVTDVNSTKEIIMQNEDLRKIFQEFAIKLRDTKKCDTFISKVLEYLKENLNFSSEDFKKLLLLKGSFNESFVQAIIYKSSSMIHAESRLANILKFLLKEIEIDPEILKELFYLKDYNRLKLLHAHTGVEADVLEDFKQLSRIQDKINCKNFLLSHISRQNVQYMHYFFSRVADSHIQCEIINVIFKFLKQHLNFDVEDYDDLVFAKMQDGMNVLQVVIHNKPIKAKIISKLKTVIMFLQENFKIDKETVKYLIFDKGFNGMDLIHLIIYESRNEDLATKLLIEFIQYLKSDFSFNEEDFKLILSKDYSDKSVIQCITENVNPAFVGKNVMQILDYAHKEFKFEYENLKILFPKSLENVQRVVDNEDFKKILELLQPKSSKKSYKKK